MGCCNNKITYDFSNPSEKIIREILKDMKIFSYNKFQFQNILNQQFSKYKNYQMKKIFFVPLFEDYIISNEKKTNNSYDIHLRIFDLFLDFIEKFNSKEEILLKIFPLLNKLYTYEENDFNGLIRKYFSNEVSYTHLRGFLVNLFIFYSHKINKIIIFYSDKNKLKAEAHKMNEEFFYYENIYRSVEKILAPLCKGRNNEEEEDFIIPKQDLHLIFREIETLSHEGIRDYIINFKLNDNGNDNYSYSSSSSSSSS